jgi:hypothetical protein
VLAQQVGEIVGMIFQRIADAVVMDEFNRTGVEYITPSEFQYLPTLYPPFNDLPLG